MFEKVTLLTPSYRRQEYISRLVSFYSNIPVNLIIVDGTESGPLFDSIDLRSAGSIKYFYQPGRSIFDRLVFATQHLNTPYVAWLGDDEFHVPSGLMKSIKILEQNTKVSSAIGLCAGFRVESGHIYWGNYYNYSPVIFRDRPAQRIENYFAHYSPTMAYSVWRSANYLRASKIMFDRNWGSGNLAEFMYAFCGISDGIHVVHDRLQWLRSTENPPQQEQLYRNISISKWSQDERYLEEHGELFSRLQQYISESLNCSIQQGFDYVKLAFCAYQYHESHSLLLSGLGLAPSKSYDRNYKADLLEFSRSQRAKMTFSTDELSVISGTILSTYS